jgi:hypothetical protein
MNQSRDCRQSGTELAMVENEWFGKWFSFVYFIYTGTATLLFVAYLQPEDVLVITLDT